jgi:hypothetical protein
MTNSHTSCRAELVISSSFFDLSSSQTLGQHSNILTLDDETWYQSDDMSNPASISRMLHTGTNPTRDRWGASLQEDVCAGNLQDSDWWGDLANFNGLHVLSKDGDKGAGINALEPQSYQSIVQFSGLTPAPGKDPDTRGLIKSTSSNVDCAYTQSTEAPPPLEKVDSGIQEFDRVQLYTTMIELKSQLRKREGHSILKEPILDRDEQPSLAKQDGLALLLEQCLTTLRGFTTNISEAKKDRTGLEDRGKHNRYGTDMELQMIVEHLWNAMRVESCRIPSRLF